MISDRRDVALVCIFGYQGPGASVVFSYRFHTVSFQQYFRQQVTGGGPSTILFVSILICILCSLLGYSLAASNSLAEKVIPKIGMVKQHRFLIPHNFPVSFFFFGFGYGYCIGLLLLESLAKNFPGTISRGYLLCLLLNRARLTPTRLFAMIFFLTLAKRRLLPKLCDATIFCTEVFVLHLHMAYEFGRSLPPPGKYVTMIDLFCNEVHTSYSRGGKESRISLH
ncbi:hypothetical protein B0H63DRAFT_308015 [Podospora didyma]|uniref:Uncharacterized protein n=1 Tax=Podospora didyma TaxID=330526 RepID=A0AAE0N4Q8_9PEZI|nr:hypothetical protein B0H63DRAFT_308015 [Podospora didyma]